MAAAARAAAQWEAWVENSVKVAPTAAAGKVVGARAVVLRVEASSAELEGWPAEAAAKEAISVPYLARTVAGTAWVGTVAVVGARRAPRSALPPIGIGLGVANTALRVSSHGCALSRVGPHAHDLRPSDPRAMRGKAFFC